MAELARTEERERRAIAADLHDQIGQALAIARAKLVRLHGDALFYGLEDQVDEVCQYLDVAIARTRSLTAEICSPILYELGLAPALEWLGEKFTAKHRLPVRVTTSGQPRALAEETRNTLFRAVRELLRNVVKHARATTAAVACLWDPTFVEITVSDDGVGLDPARPLTRTASQDCFGLFHVRERMRHLGGAMTIRGTGPGTEIRLRVPLPAETPAGGAPDGRGDDERQTSGREAGR